MTHIHQRDTRGQMILIGALLLAVTLVALALVTNSVIYTENLASRDEVSTEDAVSFRQAAGDGSQRAIIEANFGQDDVDYDTRFATFKQSTRDWGRRSTSFLSTSGVSGEVTASGLTKGTRVSHDTAGNFDPANQDLVYGIDPGGLNTHETWVVANGTDLRRFQMTVDRSSLFDKTTTGSDRFINEMLGVDPYFIGTEGSDDVNYYTFVTRNSNTAAVNVTTYRWDESDALSGATVVGTCDIQGSEATLDVTGGQVISENEVKPCPALDFYDEVPDDPDTFFANGDSVVGTYKFVAEQDVTTFRNEVAEQNQDYIDAIDAGADTEILNDEDGFSVSVALTLTISPSDTYGDESTDGDPYTNTALWSADVGVTYVTKSVSYETSMTVAPGMPGGSSVISSGGTAGNSAPSAEYSYTPSDPETGETINFDASASSDSDGTITYAWDVDEDGDDELTGQSPSYSYSSTGFYDVVLTVTDDDGATDTRTQTVQVTSSAETAPVVQSLSATDESYDDGTETVEYDVSWDVHDDDGDLAQVTVELFRNNNNQQVDSRTITTLGGTDATGTTTVTWESGGACGKDVYVKLTVQDAAGKTNSDTTGTLSPSC